jgi:REP element-mobilizing transposase RayT
LTTPALSKETDKKSTRLDWQDAMTRPRKALISCDDTPYYHCVSRCVRRAFLCGYDRLTARSFEHRRGWIVRRIKELAAVFAIDVAAFCAMSNHVHTVLHVDPKRAAAWTTKEVFERWTQLFAGPDIVQRYLRGDPLLAVELTLLDSLCATYRERLCSISWFMRCLNEPIARWANAEDGCTGRFWESRFKCQALLDEVALLSCMTYVDLNPIRAGIAKPPEQSDYTSIQERLGIRVERSEAERGIESSKEALLATHERKLRKRLPLAELMAFGGWSSGSSPEAVIPYALADYIELVDWAGRIVREDKKGFIDAATPPILQRLGVDPDVWLDAALHFQARFHSAVGPVASLQALCNRLGRKWLREKRACGMLYPDPSPA